MAQIFTWRTIDNLSMPTIAARLNATDADAAADRDTQAAALRARLKRIETGQNSCILELEERPADTASAAMRTRIRGRFTELHTERQQLETQLAALTQASPQAADLSLLDQLPLVGDILPGLDPDLKARLYQAFDLQVLWNKPAPMGDLFESPIEVRILHVARTFHANSGLSDTGEADGASAALGDSVRAALGASTQHGAKGRARCLSLLPGQYRATGPGGPVGPEWRAGPAGARSAWPGRVIVVRS